MSEDWRDLEIQIEREEEIANRIFQFECFCLPHRTNCWSFYFGRRHLIWLFKFKSLPCITSFGLGYLIGRSGWMIGDGQRALGEHWRWELEHWVSIWWWAPCRQRFTFFVLRLIITLPLRIWPPHSSNQRLTRPFDRDSISVWFNKPLNMPSNSIELIGARSIWRTKPTVDLHIGVAACVIPSLLIWSAVCYLTMLCLT